MWSEAVAGGADFLIDLKAALQGAAVIGAERAFKGEVHILGRQAGGIHRRARPVPPASRPDCQCERKSYAHRFSHSAAAAAESPSTDWAMEAGSFFGVSIRPTMGMIRPEEGEVVSRRQTRHPDQRHAGHGGIHRLRTAIAQDHADHHEGPEELLHQGAEAAGAHPAGVQPGNEEQRHDGAAHHDHAHQLVRDGAQHGVEGQQIPFRHDVGRRHQRIGLDVIVRVAEEVRGIEHEDREEDHEQARDRRRPSPCNRDGRAPCPAAHFTSMPSGLLLPGTCSAQICRPTTRRDDEGQQIMQREEAVQGGVAHREIAPQPGGDMACRPREWR